jgi:large subunit ribosomal protein L10
MSKVQEYKKKEVELLKELAKKYRVVGIADLTGMPSAPLQRMRKQLKGVVIRITKKRLLKIALEQLEDEKLKGIKDSLEGIMPCLIFTNDGSFKLAKLLRQGKINAAAKAGQVAPKDLTVEKGPTSFTPGPIIGELGALGLKAGVEAGKVVVKEDSILVKKGQVISAKAADLLSKLGVEPMEIGLSLVATYENGIIYNKEVLDVDEKVYIDEISRIAKEAFLLTIGIGYVVKENISTLLSKAYREASILMEKSDMLTPEKMGMKLVQAEKEAETLNKE